MQQRKKDALVISIDYAKAFDTVSIKFMSECYRFFGFGPRFINMLETVGSNRRASILLDDCKLSRTFDLETGRPQGDNLTTYPLLNATSASKFQSLG